jgi:glycosyltransferase involved in cell wall biosynthesis
MRGLRMGKTMFSVIIPTLNEEKNLGICFKSLMEQTYREFEVIIVDGGSQDRTVDMAERNGFDILEVEKTRPHDVSAAKNEGAKHARGDILFFLDADMALKPNCFEVLDGEYRNPDVIGVACKVLPLEGNGLETVMYQCNNILARFANYVGVHEFSYFSCHSYRRDFFEKVGGFREDLLACEDLDLSLRIRQLGRYTVTTETTIWTSPRRLREWSYPSYVLRYAKYLAQYYLTNRVADLYEDL